MVRPLQIRVVLDLLCIQVYLFFHAKMGCSVSTNTRAELLALWELLVFVVSLGLPSLFVYGHSQVIINWEKFVARLDSIDLNH